MRNSNAPQRTTSRAKIKHHANSFDHLVGAGE
jgi:hypothetical protein